jgi:hypothetical protein
MSKSRDWEDERLLAQLQGTPVGRRWLLKAGLGSAAAAAAASLGPAATARAAQETPRARAAAAAGWQFALDVPGVSGLMLVANGVEVPLVAHTGASRSALRALGGLWKVMDLGALSHFVPPGAVPALPSSRGMLTSVQGRRGRRNVLAGEVWHVPAAAVLALAEASDRLLGSFDYVVGDSPRLRELGLTLKDFRSAAEVVQLDLVGDAYQSAAALTMSHPQVATLDPMAAATTKAVLGDTPPVQALGTYIRVMQRAGRDFATLEEAVDPDGSPSVIQVGDTETTFATIVLNNTDTRFTTAATASVMGGITAVRDTGSLGEVSDGPLEDDPGALTKTWVQPQGLVPQSQPAAQVAAQSGLSVKVQNPGWLTGTKTQAGGLSGTKVELTVYNNYVRWIWVYVQYLGTGGNNLSTNPKATFPDGKYSKFLGVLQAVPTVFGLPLLYSNSLKVTLDFPPGAVSARLLYCSLGADIVGGGWRQYFPPKAYPDGAIAPTDEVQDAALATGVLCIGLNLIALAADIELVRTWTTVRAFFKDPEITREAMEGLLSLAFKVTVGEALTRAVCGGFALYSTLADLKVNISNLWGLLVQMGTIVPKLLFAKGAPNHIWKEVGQSLLVDESAARVSSSVPFIGQAIAVMSLAGDIATLAQVATEFMISPWIIENQVSFTYEATVTISRDPRSATFPATARSWRLEALVDGAAVLSPVTGTVNEGGVLRSDPLVVPVKGVPFGGATIQWSAVFLDAAGLQVGTGVSPGFVNNDPAHVPDAVAFAITQLPATITAATVFKRTVTTAYSAAAGGYVWSPEVTVAATLGSAGAVDVISTSVATLAGVAGVVWREGDRYYLRGVPVAQNGRTIQLGTAPREGYARRPFLLLDAFVEPSSAGNHVLLEPDEATSGYVIRKVSLNAVTGALSWDPAVIQGMFVLPVSAAALHSSGRVVAVSTEAGRLGWVQPVDTSGRPQLAAYTAGPGTQVGLLSSPVALAVTNPGTVLVLEAASRRLSAFDLNGNPAEYFTAGPAPGYTLPLVSDGTYLDVAVDGAEQIYLLYFTGTGTAPANYRVDVYTKDGSPLATRSPGVNVPHLAVDYWRSIFAANYAPLADLGTTTAHVSPALGVPEPSVSRFDPTQP